MRDWLRDSAVPYLLLGPVLLLALLAVPLLFVGLKIRRVLRRRAA